MEIAARTFQIDLEYQGVTEAIGVAVLEAGSGLALIDPGPTPSLATLRTKLDAMGASFAAVRSLLLTHIHLDHAAATGVIVRENPHIQVYVHARGAPHMIDPSKLLASARRIYGDDMDRLWGEIAPVPAANVHALEGGESLELGGRWLEVAYTPGHASHHVSLLDRETGIAFTGDAAGMRLTGRQFVLPWAPPPDIDIEKWHDSLDQLKRWHPEQLFLSHFGLTRDVENHLEETRHRVDAWAAMVRDSLGNGCDDAANADWFAKRAAEEVRRHLSEEDTWRLMQTGNLRSCWDGLARYWRKKQ